MGKNSLKVQNKPLAKSLISINDYAKFLFGINLVRFNFTTFLFCFVSLIGSCKILLHMNFGRTEIHSNHFHIIFVDKLSLKLNEPFLEEKKFGMMICHNMCTMKDYLK